MNHNIKIDVMGIGKAVFVSALCLRVGECVGDLVCIMIQKETTKAFKTLAARGNKAAQRACENLDLDYDTDMKKSGIQNKNPIGFHA